VGSIPTPGSDFVGMTFSGVVQKVR
jgi:hypothetical protein